MTAVFSKISDFGHFFYLVISKMGVNYESLNCILKCFFAVLKYFWNLGEIKILSKFEYFS